MKFSCTTHAKIKEDSQIAGQQVYKQNNTCCALHKKIIVEIINIIRGKSFWKKFIWMT